MGQSEKEKTVKRYYWLKLKEEFFLDKEVKKLRKIAGGDTYTIIYLKLMLLSLKTDGKLYFDGIEDTFAEELALEIDEDPENVRVTLMYLKKMSLLTLINEDEIYLTQMDNLIGSESESAERVRKHRAKIKEIEDNNKSLEMGKLTDNTESNGNSLEDKTLHCNDDVTECNTYTDIDIDKELNTKTNIKNSSNTNVLDCPTKSDKQMKYLFPNITEMWNELASFGIAPIRGITKSGSRATLLKARLREYGENSFAEIVQQVKDSLFLQGKHDGRPWQITFDWVILPKNYPKVLEGTYKDNNKQYTGSAFDHINIGD